MPILRLTSKLLTEIDDRPSPDTAATPSPLGDWYGHVFTIERHKCIMFVNEPTLFVGPVLGVVKADYRQIVPFFVNVLGLKQAKLGGSCRPFSASGGGAASAGERLVAFE